jgi:hypothetical protein
MVGAEAAAGGYEGGMWVKVPDEGKDLVEDISFVVQVSADALCRVQVFGVEAFAVHAIEAIDLDGARFDLFAHGVDDLPVFVVIESRGAGREEEYGVTSMAEDKEFHVSAEMVAMPFVIFSFHVVLADRYCKMISFHKA